MKVMGTSGQAVDLDVVRSDIEQEICRFETHDLPESDFLRPKSIFGSPMYPSEMLELWDRLGIRRTMDNYNDLMHQATMLKREGDLAGANRVYINIFRSQEKLDKDFIWPWCKIMILAKNFEDLALLLRLLFAFNVREEISAEKACGNVVASSNSSFICNPALYLRDLCDSALASKQEVEWRFSQYGGSDYWASYQLSDMEYRDFQKYFSLEKAGIKQQPIVAGSSKLPQSPDSSQQSGGCYIATAVYGTYDCPEVWVLRRFRDRQLAPTCVGRLAIRLYYNTSPWMVEHLGALKPIRVIWKKLLDCLIAGLRERGFDDSPYSDDPCVTLLD